MKKIKLLSSLSTVGALGGGVAALATSCTWHGGFKEKEDEGGIITVDAQPETVTLCQKTDKLELGKVKLATIDGTYINTKEEAGKLTTSVKFTPAEYVTKTYSTPAFDGEDIIFTAPTSKNSNEWILSLDTSANNIGSSNSGTYSITVLWTPKGQSTAVESKPFDFTIDIKENVFVVDGKTYVLEDEVDPTNMNWNLYKQKYPLKNGEVLEFQEYADMLKVTDVVLGSFDPSKTALPDGFFKECNNMTSLKIYGGNNITHVGDYFLLKAKITELVLDGLINVEDIKQDFLYDCNKIKSIDISMMVKLKKIEWGFFMQCAGAEEVKLPNPSSITVVGAYLCWNCSSLTTFDASSLINLESIDQNFLDGCTSLTDLYVPLKNPTTFTTNVDGFLNGVPADCKIHAGEYADLYKSTSPWKARSQYIDNQTI